MILAAGAAGSIWRQSVGKAADTSCTPAEERRLVNSWLRIKQEAQMKKLDDLIKTPRLQILQATQDGGRALAHLISSKRNKPAGVVFSWGGGWDHVSVSFTNRCPTWEEMCEVKNMFFEPDEACFQLHPIQTEYVNMHPYCLHIWRLQEGEIPTPPSWMVGAKRDQSIREALREGAAAFNNMRQEMAK